MGYLGGPRSVFTLYAHFLGKKKTSMYISRDKGDHHYIQTQHNDFFPITIFFYENLKKNWPEKGV